LQVGIISAGMYSVTVELLARWWRQWVVVVQHVQRARCAVSSRRSVPARLGRRAGLLSSFTLATDIGSTVGIDNKCFSLCALPSQFSSSQWISNVSFFCAALGDMFIVYIPEPLSRKLVRYVKQVDQFLSSSSSQELLTYFSRPPTYLWSLQGKNLSNLPHTSFVVN